MRNIRTVPQLLVRIFVRPLFPFFQWLAVFLKIVKAPERGPHVLGKVRDGLSAEEVEKVLKKEGFFQNRIAYTEPGQVLSMRCLDKEDPDCQYHIRVFSDGEIRGHHETTPADHPHKHIKQVELTHKPEKFAPWIKDIT